MNREKFEAELGAAGVRLKGLDDDGRAVLIDGTIVPAGWDGDAGGLRHDARSVLLDTQAAWLYRNTLRAHDPAPTPAQLAREARRALHDPTVLEALLIAASTTATAGARAQAQAKVNAAARKILDVGPPV